MLLWGSPLWRAYGGSSTIKGKSVTPSEPLNRKNQMHNSGSVLRKALLSMTCAIALAGCTTSGGAPVNSLELSAVVADLPGTQGRTLEDQRRIDRTVARSCAAGILGTKQCDLQTVASAARKAAPEE